MALSLTDPWDSNWHPNCESTAHIIGDLGILIKLHPCTSDQKMYVGNNPILHATHKGSIIIPYNEHDIHLNNILLVPGIKEYLLYVCQLLYGTHFFHEILTI